MLLSIIITTGIINLIIGGWLNFRKRAVPFNKRQQRIALFILAVLTGILALFLILFLFIPGAYSHSL
jgi:uncharacterized membrane protein